jgi:hypothetical protein
MNTYSGNKQTKDREAETMGGQEKKQGRKKEHNSSKIFQ